MLERAPPSNRPWQVINVYGSRWFSEDVDVLTISDSEPFFGVPNLISPRYVEIPYEAPPNCKWTHAWSAWHRATAPRTSNTSRARELVASRQKTCRAMTSCDSCQPCDNRLCAVCRSLSFDAGAFAMKTAWPTNPSVELCGGGQGCARKGFLPGPPEQVLPASM